MPRPGESCIEPREFVGSQASAHVAGIVAVEHDELPAVRHVRAADLKRRAVELSAHGVGFVVVSGNAQHRLIEVAEDAAKAQIAGRIVLHQITGDQNGRVVRNARKRILEHRVQTRVRLDTAQPAGGAAVKMRIGDL